MLNDDVGAGGYDRDLEISILGDFHVVTWGKFCSLYF